MNGLVRLALLCAFVKTTRAQTVGSVDVNINGLGDVRGSYIQEQLPFERMNSFCATLA